MHKRSPSGKTPQHSAPLSRVRIAVSAFVVSFSLSVPRASALELDSTDGLNTQTIAGRERQREWERSNHYGTQTVTGRGRDFAKPDGIRAGNYIIFPEAGAAVVFDDNIYARDIEKRSDIRTELSGGVKFQSDLPRHMLDFSLDGKVVSYAEHSDQNYANIRAKLESAVHFDHAHTLSASLLSAIEHEERTDPSYPLTAKGPVEVFHNRAAVGITRDVGRLYGTLSASAESWDFSDTTAVNGSSIDLDPRDTVRYATQLRFGYRFSPGFGFVGKVRGLRDENRGENSTNVSDPIDADAWGYEALAGLAFEANPLLRWRIMGGYGIRDYNSKDLADVTTSLLEASVQWLPTQRLTIYAALTREIDASSGEISGGVVQTGAKLRADYEIYHNIILYGALELRRDDFRNADRKDDIYSIRTGVDYYFTKNWLFTFGYEHQVRDSSEDQLDMHRNRFMIGAKLRF